MHNSPVQVLGKRDLIIWQKRPKHMKKETSLYGKRDLSIWQHILKYMVPDHVVKDT
jgi:hypothetical protein